MSYTLFRIQCQVLEITLSLAEREYLRYPPGTIVDGVNVGGQFAKGKSQALSLKKSKLVSTRNLSWVTRSRI